jgi:hypothetical protein
MTDTDLQQIEAAFERVLHRNGLVNGHPLTMTERQGIAIQSVLTAGHRAVQVLLAKGAIGTAAELNDVMEQLKKEFHP